MKRFIFDMIPKKTSLQSDLFRLLTALLFSYKRSYGNIVIIALLISYLLG